MVTVDPKHCRSCGAPLRTVRLEGRDRDYCDACEEPVYWNPKPAAGIVVVDGDSVLLIRRTNPPVGMWSLPAGFLDVDEPPRDAAVREPAEEAGLSVPSTAPTLFDTSFVTSEEASSVLIVVYAVDRAETSGDPAAGSDADATDFFTDEQLVECDAIEPGYRELFRRAIREFGDSE
ncbi:MAG: NUDIX domain-containing protein [Halobellus sp.]|uniref:NUDIX domain-containing protein n=1 Tax=Halobellus sp. TaxID=1979212 RepID=UPI0035D3F238